jgi:hypothetical protein
VRVPSPLVTAFVWGIDPVLGGGGAGPAADQSTIRRLPVAHTSNGSYSSAA